MRAPFDVLRSLNKYVALALGPEWEVRFAVEEGDFERPFCRVNPSTPVQSTAVGIHHVERRRTFAIVCFPSFTKGDGTAMSEEEASAEAARVEELLFVAFSKGVHAPSFRSSSNRAHPLRIPLWSFDGVTLDETIEEAEVRDGIARRAANDFMAVIEPPSAHGLPDPNDDRAFIVTGDVRVKWMSNVAVPATEPLMTAEGGVQANPIAS